MRARIPKILVTGGAGFIGSEFVRQAAGKYRVIVLDKLTYAADLKRLFAVKGKYKFYKADICDKKMVGKIFKTEKPDIVINFAAETHVDRSIIDASPFMRSNILGVQVLLDICRLHKVKRFIQISTDEVYGDIKKGKFTENSPLRPNSPYAASKASADLLLAAYIRTYQFPAMIIRPANNYGPWQYPEKFIPVIIAKLLSDDFVPVYSKGENIREWLYVGDCARGILKIMRHGNLGGIYNLGSGDERKNINLVKLIAGILNKPERLIKFVKDRLGHDLRYALDSAKIRKLGWQPEINFATGINRTVFWYHANSSWINEKKKHLEKYWKKVYLA